MTRRVRRIVVAALALVAVAALAGCKATGGGYIPSAFDSSAKATFGFVWQDSAKGNSTSVKGSWNDGYVKFKLDGGYLYDGNDNCLSGSGTYVSTSKTSPGQGTVNMTICDYGEPGPTNGDSIQVYLYGGPYDGYSNSGTLQGGNLQVKY